MNNKEMDDTINKGILFYYNLAGARIYLTDCKLKDVKDVAEQVRKGTPIQEGTNHPDVFFSFEQEDYLVASDNAEVEPEDEIGLDRLILLAWQHGYCDGAGANIAYTTPFIAKGYRDKILDEYREGNGKHE